MQSQAPSRSRNAGTENGFRNDADLDELLGLASSSPRNDVALSAIARAPEVQAEVYPRSLNDIFTNYLKFESDLAKLCESQKSSQKLLFGDDWLPISDSPKTQGIYEVAISAIANLIRLAQDRFAPAGGSLQINRSEALAAVGMSSWQDDYERRYRRSECTDIPDIDLDKLWAYLETTYGGDAGIEVSHRQNAQFLIKKLRLAEEMKRTARSVSCFMHFYGRIIQYGPNAGRYDRGHVDRSEDNKMFKGIASAFEWAELDQLSIELHPSRHSMCDYDFNYKPRDRINFTGMEIVLFKDKWEIKFDHKTAEKLMLYLGTYGEI